MLARQFGSKIFMFIIALGAMTQTGCSPAGLASTEGMFGGLAGAAVGSGVGALLADQSGGSMGKNIALNAAIGAGVGLLGGSILGENNLKIQRQREIVLREAELIDENQRELDLLRGQIDESSSWGRNEVKPWNERYPAEDLQLPFDGPRAYLRR